MKNKNVSAVGQRDKGVSAACDAILMSGLVAVVGRETQGSTPSAID